MGLSALHLRRKSSPRWTYTVENIIWRVYPTRVGKVVGEERDPAGKRARFFCVDQGTGSVLWQKAILGDQWWVGVEAVHENILLLHGFATPVMPGHKGIIAVDLEVGAKVWENANVAFISAEGHSLFAWEHSTGERRMVELNCKTGERINSWGERESEQKRVELRHRGKADLALEFPQPFADLASVPPRLAEVVERHTRGKLLIGPLEVLEHRSGFVIFSFHTGRETLTDQHRAPALSMMVTVVNMLSGKVLMQDVAYANISAPVPDPFFVQHDFLYYVKERKTLAAVHLAHPSARTQ